MKKLKIIGMFLFGFLSFVGISQRDIPGGENNIYTGVICLFLSLLLLFSLKKKKNIPNKSEVFLPPQDISDLNETKEITLSDHEDEYCDPKMEHVNSIRTVSLFLKWCKKHPRILCTEQYPSYMNYSWGIENPLQFHKQLIQEGYLVKMDLNQKLKTLKVVDLRDVLRSQNLPVSGKKQELIDRILKHADLSLIPLNGENQEEYCLSTKALDYLSKCDDIISLNIASSDIESYKMDGVERYQIRAALDSKTCEICGELDGKIFLVENAVIGLNFPPFHSGCRCTTVSHYDDTPTEGLTRVARDKDGNNIYVPESMTYKEYKEKYLQPPMPTNERSSRKTMSC